MIRAVVDANTLVSAVINKPFSVSQEIYQNFINKNFLLIASPSLLSELEDVLTRDRIAKLHKKSAKELQKVIVDIGRLSYIVAGTTDIKIVRDPKDDKIIIAAVEGNADYIVSRDKDLLDIREYQSIKIITPEKFMEILRLQD